MRLLLALILGPNQVLWIFILFFFFSQTAVGLFEAAILGNWRRFDPVEQWELPPNRNNCLNEKQQRNLIECSEWETSARTNKELYIECTCYIGCNPKIF
jgi:hypothetical protein